MIRTTYNILSLGLKEATSSNANLRQMGYRRLIGSLVTLGGAEKADTTSDDRKTPEVERSIIETAQNNIFAARDILKNKDSTKEQKLQAERTIKVNQNVLVKELGVPAEYAAIISSAELFDAEMDAVVATHNAKQEELAKDYLENNPDAIPTEVLKMFHK